MNLKGTVTRVFTAKDSGFKILVLKVDDLKTIPVEKRNPDYPDSVSVVGLLRGVEENLLFHKKRATRQGVQLNFL